MTPLPPETASNAVQRVALDGVRAELSALRKAFVEERRQLENARVVAENDLKNADFRTYTHISALPFEILSIIFVFCLPKEGGPPSASSAPLLLLHVCRRWRAVARTEPQLWNALELRLYSVDTGSYPFQLRRTKLLPGNRLQFFDYWTRAGRDGRRELTLRQSTTQAVGRSAYNSLLPICLMTLPLTTLRSLEADLSPQQMKHILLPNKPLPYLETLTAALHTRHLENILQTAPRLRFLRLRELSARAVVSSPTLTHLEIDQPASGATFNALSTIFVGCIVLEHLKCAVASPTSAELGQEPINVPTLRSLHLSSSPTFDSFLVLSLLTLPNLTTLATSMSGSAALRILTEFQARSSCTIQTLSLVRPCPVNSQHMLSDRVFYGDDEEWFHHAAFACVSSLDLDLTEGPALGSFPDSDAPYADIFDYMPSIQQLTLHLPALHDATTTRVNHRRLCSMLDDASLPVSLHVELTCASLAEARPWTPPHYLSETLRPSFSYTARSLTANQTAGDASVLACWPDDLANREERCPVKLHSDVIVDRYGTTTVVGDVHSDSEDG
uniref:F-box domain-containing protein n=1 Tax=Mycena chlorophos TaxID=658473 RepID=A0ABQ0L2E9_MYCCL|nr:predicted protein [Mycena chlorophos]